MQGFKSGTLTEAEFRKLCDTHGSPDLVPMNFLPFKVAAALSMADRFFEEPDDVDAAVAELRQFNLLTD